MGLDWVPMGRPKPDHEAEYDRLWNLLFNEFATNEDEGTDEDFDRFEQIIIEPYDDVGAPLIGTDPVAIELFHKMKSSGLYQGISEQEFLASDSGKRFVDHLEQSDLVPSLVGSLSIISFRGEWVSDLGSEFDEVTARGWANMSASDALKFANELEEFAGRYAQENDEIAWLTDRTTPPNEEFDNISPRSKIYVLMSAVRYLRGWASLGHSIEADF